jgi:hypothetical protein
MASGGITVTTTTARSANSVLHQPVTTPTLSQRFLTRGKKWIKESLELAKDEAKKGVDTSIVGVMTTTGCHHACKHCGECAPAYEKGQVITLDTIHKARQTLGFNTPNLTGGEPLDHPQILEILDVTEGRVEITNGFSPFVHPKENWSTILDGVVFDGSVSFQIFDRWNGVSEGRDAVIKYLILNASECNVRLIAIPSNVKDTIIAWAKTILRLLSDEQVLESLRTDTFSRDLFSGLPCIGDVSISTVLKTGRGQLLSDALWSNRISCSLNLPDFSKPLDPEDAPFGGTFLDPNGTLGAYFLACNHWFHHKKARIGATIHDDVDMVQERLVRKLVDYFEEKLQRDDAIFESELFRMADNTRLDLELERHIWLARYDPEVIKLFEEINRTLTSNGISLVGAQFDSGFLRPVSTPFGLFYAIEAFSKSANYEKIRDNSE